jgi:hypothetical protein
MTFDDRFCTPRDGHELTCLSPEDGTYEGAANPTGDARLMLHALTRGWRCERAHLYDTQNVEAWRWSHEGPLGGEAWSVAGAWSDGPVVDGPVRQLLLVSVG